jgi:hypothetical protein
MLNSEEDVCSRDTEPRKTVDHVPVQPPKRAWWAIDRPPHPLQITDSSELPAMGLGALS